MQKTRYRNFHCIYTLRYTHIPVTEKLRGPIFNNIFYCYLIYNDRYYTLFTHITYNVFSLKRGETTRRKTLEAEEKSTMPYYRNFTHIHAQHTTLGIDFSVAGGTTPKRLRYAPMLHCEVQ